MKRTVLVSTIFLLGSVLTNAQTGLPAGGSKPASSNVRGAEFPRVTDDLRAIFRIKAPDAGKVEVQVGKKYDMAKDSAGFWSVTTDPLVPGFHYYFLFINGVQVSDPASETFFGWGRMSGGIEIPEAGVDFYSLKDVPHGDIRQKWYFSEVTGAWRRCFVYCPPGYNESTPERYPVLYLQHGSGEDERSWGVQGRADIIMDNLIAERKALPMLIVMDQGYAVRKGAQSAAAPQPAGQQQQGPSAFEEVVIKDLIPFIDSHFRTLSDRGHRAMAGLSMGGGQTLQITTRNLDKFAYIGGFSGTGRLTADSDLKTVFNGAFADAKSFNSRVKLVWIGIGTAEPENMYKGVKGFHEALEKIGIRHVYYESPGTDHEWQTWRRSLHEFAPLLFR
ncbi:MAG: alpha/beta hydrolase-fold protein [Bacteroidales bacterium]|jgi:enterochelin esterase family protein|nr:alpha/beta hydrolase-fold protein [Bacteroidales bacterium]MCU0407342.1 alpha/beta hydrolase-fold protein [Bacteroidales bacterium]